MYTEIWIFILRLSLWSLTILMDGLSCQLWTKEAIAYFVFIIIYELGLFVLVYEKLYHMLHKHIS